MSMDKGKSHQDPSTVWGGQSPYLKNLYQQGQQLLPQSMQFGQQMLPQIQNMMTPQGFQDTYSQLMNPYLQNINQAGIMTNNLGGDRLGVATAQAGQNVAGQYMQALPQLYNLGMQAGGWGPLQQLAGILGNPAILAGGGSSMKLGFGVGQ